MNAETTPRWNTKSPARLADKARRAAAKQYRIGVRMLAAHFRCKQCGFIGHRREFPCNRTDRSPRIRCLVCTGKYQRSRYEANTDRRRAATRQWNIDHQGMKRRAKRRREDANLPAYLWKVAKRRAQAKGLPFDIMPGDIIIPARCPLLGIVLRRSEREKGGWLDQSPTLDRRVPALGYVKGNVWVISWRANRLKSDGTLAELEMLVANLRASVGGGT
jgi:hypothetical protein